MAIEGFEITGRACFERYRGRRHVIVDPFQPRRPRGFRKLTSQNKLKSETPKEAGYPTLIPVYGL
jgi:hypothetical protein